MAQALGGNRRGHARRPLYTTCELPAARPILQRRLPAARRVGDHDLSSRESSGRFLRARLGWPALRGSGILPDPSHRRWCAARKDRADERDHTRLLEYRGHAAGNPRICLLESQVSDPPLRDFAPRLETWPFLTGPAGG